MQDPLLSLFPLQLVLLPGAALPLHIFEERYKEMIGEAIENKTEFGVVQAADKGILNIGCTATVDSVLNRHPDGRLDIVTIGRRRFEIHLLDQAKPYLRANVSFFDDDEDRLPALDLRLTALAGYRLLANAAGLEGEGPSINDPKLSFAIAQHLDDLQLRQLMLALRSEEERLQQLTAFLPQYVARLRRAEHIKKVAPLNGHGLLASNDSE